LERLNNNKRMIKNTYYKQRSWMWIFWVEYNKQCEVACATRNYAGENLNSKLTYSIFQPKLSQII
jgi:hypothetical protein